MIGSLTKSTHTFIFSYCLLLIGTMLDQESIPGILTLCVRWKYRLDGTPVQCRARTHIFTHSFIQGAVSNSQSAYGVVYER